jgi:hypothetical protein
LQALQSYFVLKIVFLTAKRTISALRQCSKPFIFFKRTGETAEKAGKGQREHVDSGALLKRILIEDPLMMPGHCFG